MAVTDNTTLIEDHETAPTYTSIGGGQGASQNADFYFKGANSSTRRLDNVTKNGFWWTDGTAHNISGAGTHAMFFINCITQALFTDFWIRLGTSTTVYEEFNPGVAFYDTEAGGWIPIWVEVDAGTDTGVPDFTQIDFFAVICSMGDIASNLKNLQTDQARYSTRPVMTWDSTGGDLDDFIATETNATTGGQGALKELNGLYTCFANLQLGSATSTTFDFDGKTIVFPDAAWLPAASTWMGFDIDLQHASTAITGTGGSFISGNPTGASARLPDFLVTGTSGTLDVTGRVFDGLRCLDFTSGVTADDTVISHSGVVTIAGASMLNATVSNTNEVAGGAAMLWNDTGDPDGELDGITVTKGTAATAAIEFGSSTPGTINLRNWTTSGYNASDGNNDSTFYNNTGGALTINVFGGSGNFTYRDGAGASTTVVVDPVTTLITVKDIETNSVIQNARVLLLASDGSGPLPYQESVTSITRSGVTATANHSSHGMATGDVAYITGANEWQYNGAHTITVTGTNTYTYTIPSDPGTDATGTLLSTGGIFNELSDSGGEVSDLRAWSSAQPVTGSVRFSTSTKYKPAPINGVISITTGLDVTASLIPDE